MLPRHLDPLKVTRVTDDQGLAWTRWLPVHADHIPPPVPYGVPSSGFMWRVWANAVLLAMPAQRTGLWQLEHVTPRATPANDTARLDIDAGDEPIVLAQAVAILLHHDAVANGHSGVGRSSRDPRIALTRAAQLDADRLLGERDKDGSTFVQ